MVSSKVTGFRKNEDCPSSQELLDFQNGDLWRSRCIDVQAHLIRCDFCSAEVEFYSYYPQEENVSRIAEHAEIPAPLYELAESLLKNRHDASSLNSLLKPQEVS